MRGLASAKRARHWGKIRYTHGMLHCFHQQQGVLHEIPTGTAPDFEADALCWVDLNHPTAEEEASVEAHLGVNIPTRDEMGEIELSNRFYIEGEALYATATILSKSDSETPEAHPVTFVLTPHYLVTVRYSDPYAFRVAGSRAAQGIGTEHVPQTMLLVLLEAIVNRLADVLEESGHQIDEVGKTIFRPHQKMRKQRQISKPDYEEVLRQIGIYDDRISKLRESLLSISRLLGFVAQSAQVKNGSDMHVRMLELQRDIPALADHATFLSNKISFLLDATLGLISIEQSGIIKIFSVAAVIFLPPTLVASIYGMNFDFMPELSQPYGYPLALCAMVVSALLPCLYFKYRKWL